MSLHYRNQAPFFFFLKHDPFSINTGLVAAFGVFFLHCHELSHVLPPLLGKLHETRRRLRRQFIPRPGMAVAHHVAGVREAGRLQRLAAQHSSSLMMKSKMKNDTKNLEDLKTAADYVVK